MAMARRDVVIHGQGDTPAWPSAAPVFPNSSNTGYAAAGYTNLTPYTGGNVGTNGVTISGKTLGDIEITGNNTTIQGCDVSGTITIKGTATGTRIVDCNIHNPTYGSGADMLVWCQSGGTLELARCDIYWAVSDPVKLGTGPYKIRGNYIHDNMPSPDGAHADLIETWDGPCDGLEIVGNTIVYPHNSNNTTTCIMLSPGASSFYRGILVQGNLLGGCTFVIYPPGRGTSTQTPASDCRIIDNRVTTQGGLYPNGGAGGVSYRSPNVVMDWNANGNQWSGNVWHDGPNAGQTITPND